MPSSTWYAPEDFPFLGKVESAFLQRIQDRFLFIYNTIVPIGGVIAFGGATAPPDRYLQCNGQVVSQTTYAALYSVIQTRFNTGGEGAGNFRLPNLTNLATNLPYFIRAY